MSWLRLDDNFTSHPKFEGWPASDRWAFLELMGYCARYQTRGRVPNDLSLLPRPVTARLLARAEDSGWLERRADAALWIHDFEYYNNPNITGAARTRRWRNRDAKRDAQNRHTNVTRDGLVTQGVTDPVQSSPVLKTTASDLKAVRTVARASETAIDTPWTDSEDPVARLLQALPDADNGTEGVLRSYAKRLPEHAFDYTRDEVSRVHGGAGLAVTILRRIEREGWPLP